LRSRADLAALKNNPASLAAAPAHRTHQRLQAKSILPSTNTTTRADKFVLICISRRNGERIMYKKVLLAYDGSIE
jgi:hypothetical protein